MGVNVGDGVFVGFGEGLGVGLAVGVGVGEDVGFGVDLSASTAGINVIRITNSEVIMKK